MPVGLRNGIIDICFRLRVTVDFSFSQQKPYKHGQPDHSSLGKAQGSEAVTTRGTEFESSLGPTFFFDFFFARLLVMSLLGYCGLARPMFYSNCTQQV